MLAAAELLGGAEEEVGAGKVEVDLGAAVPEEEGTGAEAEDGSAGEALGAGGRRMDDPVRISNEPADAGACEGSFDHTMRPTVAAIPTAAPAAIQRSRSKVRTGGIPGPVAVMSVSKPLLGGGSEEALSREGDSAAPGGGGGGGEARREGRAPRVATAASKAAF